MTRWVRWCAALGLCAASFAAGHLSAPFYLTSAEYDDWSDQLARENGLRVAAPLYVYRMRFIEMRSNYPECCSTLAATYFVEQSAPTDALGRNMIVRYDHVRKIMLVSARGQRYPSSGNVGEVGGAIAVGWGGAIALSTDESIVGTILDSGGDARALSDDMLANLNWKDVAYTWISREPDHQAVRDSSHACLTRSEISRLGRFRDWQPDGNGLPVSKLANQMGLLRKHATSEGAKVAPEGPRSGGD